LALSWDKLIQGTIKNSNDNRQKTIKKYSLKFLKTSLYKLLCIKFFVFIWDI